MRTGIFDKTDGARYQGIVGKVGKTDFEKARKRLQRLAKWTRPPSDGDVIEALGRGWDKVEAYLKERNGGS